MKKLQPYFPLITSLARNLFLQVAGIVRSVALPGNRRKGNILSSAYRLFVGCSVELIQFREELLALPSPLPGPFPGGIPVWDSWKQSKRYLRQGLIVMAWGLFILSSLEWSGARTVTTGSTEVRNEAISTVRVVRQKRHEIVRVQDFPERLYPVPAAAFPINPPVTKRRWVLFHHLRV